MIACLATLLSPAYAQDELPEPEPVPIVDYKADAQASWLFVTVFHEPGLVASKIGHDHAVRATQFEGRIRWKHDDPTACEIELVVPVDALYADTPGLRERAKLDPDGAVNDNQLQKIRENFLGKSQLDAATHPTIVYKARRCVADGNTTRVDGELTLRGVTQPVTISMAIDATSDRFVANGRTTIKHTDFGFKPFKAPFPVPLKNKDTMDLVVNVHAVPVP